jgi:hypothetical protein
MKRKLLGYTLEYKTKNIWGEYGTTRLHFDRMMEVEDAIDILKERDIEIISMYLTTREEIVLDK